MRIAKIYLDIGVQSKALVLSHFLSVVPCQRFIELLWQLPCIPDECIDDGRGVFASGFHKHGVACLRLDQGGNLAVVAAKEKVTFPVPGYCSILGTGRTLADRYRPIDSAVVIGFLCVMA